MHTPMYMTCHVSIHDMWAYTTCHVEIECMHTPMYMTCHVSIHDMSCRDRVYAYTNVHDMSCEHTRHVTCECMAIPMIRLDVYMTCHGAMPINLMPIHPAFGEGRAAFAHSLTLALMQNAYIGTHTECVYRYRYMYVYIYIALCVEYKDYQEAVWL
jgi:hypothetical protein